MSKLSITKSYTNWKDNSSVDTNIERLMDDATYSSAHPDDTLVIAGPPRIDIKADDSEGVFGDMAAVEYGNESLIKTICRVAYTDDFIVLESINGKHAPIALVRGKDHFRIIGRIIARNQGLA